MLPYVGGVSSSQKLLKQIKAMLDHHHRVKLQGCESVHFGGAGDRESKCS